MPSEFHGDNSLAAVKVEPLTNSLATNSLATNSLATNSLATNFGASFHPMHRFQPIRDSVRGGAPRIEDLVIELKKVDWHRLGIQLRVPPDRLDKIEDDYRHSADRKLSEVLMWWLQNEKDPSWNKICEALRRMEEYANIVREIKMNYCSIDEFRTFTRRRRHYGESFEISLCPYIHHKCFICPHYDIVLPTQSLYTVVWQANPFTKEEGSGIMPIRNLFCCSEECSSNQIHTCHAVK